MPLEKSQAKWIVGIVGAVLLAMALGRVTLLQREARKPEPKKTPPPAEAPLAAGAELSYSGLIGAREVLFVPAPVEGTLETLEVEPGQEIFEGQLLGRIRNEGLDGIRAAAQEQLESAQSKVTNLESSLLAARLEVSRATADSSRAQGEYDRLSKIATRQQMLYREGATPRLTFEKAVKDADSARAEFEALRELARRAEDRIKDQTSDLEAARKTLEEREKALEAARNDLAAAEVHSPADGVLIAARAKVGDTIDAGMDDLFQISTNALKLKVTIEPEPPVLARLRAPLPVSVLVAEMPLSPIDGELAEIKDGKVTVNFDAPDAAVKPGLTATVRVKLP